MPGYLPQPDSYYDEKEHNPAARAKNVVAKGFDGANYPAIKTEADGTVNVTGSVTVTGSSSTQYTEGDVDASITGNAVMWEDSGNTLRPVSAATPLPVDVTGTVDVSDGGSSLTVDGSVAITGTVPVTDNSGSLTVDDGGLSLTVDGTVAVTDGGSTISVDDGAGSLTVDGTVAVSSVSGTVAVTLPSSSNGGADVRTADYDTGAGTVSTTMFGIALPGSGGPVAGGTTTNPVVTQPLGTYAEDAGHTTGDRGYFMLAVRNDTGAISFAGSNGDYCPVAVDANGRFFLAPSQSINVEPGDLPLTIAGSLGVMGPTAHDGSASDNPVRTAGKSSADITTAVSADGDVCDLWTDRFGRQTTAHGFNRNCMTRANAVCTNTTAEQTLIAAGGSGVYWDITDLIITNASTTDTRVDFRDSTGGSVLFSWQIPTKTSAKITFTLPLTQATANNNWTCATSGSVNAVSVTAIAYKGK